jgi:hypothetical protein
VLDHDDHPLGVEFELFIHGSLDARRRICAGVHLEAISKIAAAEGFPHIEYRKEQAFFKLANVSKLVQEQFG